ncbi:MoaD/ThiS family protein [Verminephrobacter aporrectodeae subsp. tuberculatae]|uniref:MoaD/ThiS family protein n=1 Tax=Verminephrobacter aporrectodeae subsp. tuberculatae TaxID=1110392 RepID=A0ABT3KP45_9BURK|nr:MoaD family protein [Verminephrobacter aporrectodeae]MCW5320096.1 MoaD/ThiS family protein [Verminephrobacter aporrectodeae subsp. tuberculatae]MCW8198763.1 MoaD/ThiS family protein [Verminephrobacter aporrectodeae subsp. tuberculatae]
MQIAVTIPTILRPLTGNQKQVTTHGRTLAELIDNLNQHYPGIKNRLVAEGKAHSFINIYVNDNDVRFVDNLGTTLRDGDNVTILPAVAGG